MSLHHNLLRRPGARVEKVARNGHVKEGIAPRAAVGEGPRVHQLGQALAGAKRLQRRGEAQRLLEHSETLGEHAAGRLLRISCRRQRQGRARGETLMQRRVGAGRGRKMQALATLAVTSSWSIYWTFEAYRYRLS